MSNDIPLLPMEECKEVHLSQVVQLIDNAGWVDVSLALSAEASGERFVRTLIVDILPEAWLNNPNSSPLADWPVGPYLFSTESQHTLFLHAHLPSAQVRNWFLGQQGECRIENFDPRPGFSTRALKFEMPEVQSNVLSVRVPGDKWYGLTKMPWPNTVYTCLPKQENHKFSEGSSALRLTDKWQPDNIRSYRNFQHAQADLLHGEPDPSQSHRYSDTIIVRAVHPDGWLKDLEVTKAQLTVTICGSAFRDFALGKCNLILNGYPEPHESRIITKPHQRVHFVLPLELPMYLSLELWRGDTLLDKRTVTEYKEVTNPDAITMPKRVPFMDESAVNVQATAPQQKPNYVRVLRVVIASPEDVQKERNALPNILNKLNKGLAGELGLRLEPWQWKTDAFPGFQKDGPQGQIDASMRIEDSDIVIGIFSRRFGTPIENGQSGTEHELLRAYEAWKANKRPYIMVYFNQNPPSPQNTADLDQLRAILEFKDRFPKEGLWWQYKGSTDFATRIREHLEKLLREHFGNSRGN